MAIFTASGNLLHASSSEAASSSNASGKTPAGVSNCVWPEYNTGREASGRKDIRCTVSIGGFVPKPHTPFQWAAQLDHETTDERLRKLRASVQSDKKYGKAIGLRYHDG